MTAMRGADDIGDYCECHRPVIRPKGTPAHIRIRCLECAVKALGDIVLTEDQRKRRKPDSLARNPQPQQRRSSPATTPRHSPEFARDVDTKGRV